MCIACKTTLTCDHRVTECAAIEGEYCLVCHHDSALPQPARRSAPLGARKNRASMSALLREIRTRRRRRA
jgi:hypothetical protein